MHEDAPALVELRLDESDRGQQVHEDVSVVGVVEQDLMLDESLIYGDPSTHGGKDAVYAIGFKHGDIQRTGQVAYPELGYDFVHRVSCDKHDDDDDDIL